MTDPAPEDEPSEGAAIDDAGDSAVDDAGDSALDDAGDAIVDATDDGGDPDGVTPTVLADLRADDDRRHVALVLALLVGLGLAWVHWLGLFVAGALVGLVSRTLTRAALAGLGVGVLVLVIHVGASPVMGVGEFLALAPASYVTLGAALVAPLWGSLVRGVV